MKAEIRVVGRMEVVEVGPGDTILITIPEGSSRYQRTQVEDFFQGVYPRNKVVVKTEEIKVEVQRRRTDEREPDVC